MIKTYLTDPGFALTARWALTSDGDAGAQRAFIDEYKPGNFTYILSSNHGMTYQVGKLPIAVLLDHDGVIRARGLVKSREHLESLFEAKEHGVASVQEYMSQRP